jgi:hypothetical protein
MSNRPVKENSFDAAPGGTAGAIGYSGTYGTNAGPNQTQDPDHFDSSSKNKAQNKTLGQRSNNAQDLNQPGDMAKDVNTIYAKKDTPTSDEIVSGIKYEIGQQNKKDKNLAKQTVLANLKKDPHYYRDLKMLNIDDKSMVDNMTESKHPNDAPAREKVTPNIEETKKIFAEMGKAYEKKYVVNSGICDVMKQMWEAKNQRSSWKKG